MEHGGKIDKTVVDGVLGGVSVEMLDEWACRGVVLGALYPMGFVCPGCGGVVVDSRRSARLSEGERVACAGCGKRFSALSGSVFSGTHLDYRGILLLIWMWAEGVKAARVAELVGVDVTTVRAWFRRLGEDCS